MSHTEFLLEVALSLAGCQSVELELKLYIQQAYLCSGQRDMPDISERSLGNLIKDFKQLSANSALAARLNQFREKRNFIAHQAISSCLNEDGTIDDYRIAASHLDLNTVQRDARELVDEIAVEHSKLFTIDDNVSIPPETP